MACFGCKNTVREDFEEGWVIKTGSLPKKKKKNPWISWSRPKKSPAKTVSVSVSMSEKLDSVGKSQLFKMDDVLPSKKHRHHTGVNAANKPYKKKTGTVKEIILESGEINHSNSLAREDIKHEKKHSGRKKETDKNKPSSPPENKTPVATNVENVDKNVTVKNRNKEALDSIVGMSIIIIILAVVLVWGKLCAILCTSAWLYMIPRLRTAADSDVIMNDALESDELNLYSDEHKKRVVLEGLLQRNRRSVIGLL
ncbi:hypothetical protein ACET3Z_029893 [Daucus carota]